MTTTREEKAASAEAPAAGPAGREEVAQLGRTLLVERSGLAGRIPGVNVVGGAPPALYGGEQPEADGLLRHVRAPGPLVVKAPAEAGGKMAEAIRGEAFKPLPVWEDSLTGEALDVEQLRRAMMGNG